MNFATILVLLLLFTGVFAALRSIRRSRAKGCGCGCTGCTGLCTGCGLSAKQNKNSI